MGDLELALRMADAADAVTMKRFGALDLTVDTKPDLTPVSDADTAAEVALRDILRVERPDDTIVGEEFGETGEASRCWVLDPIDGTKNYIRGVPVWATLIALATTTPVKSSSDIVLGVVSAPALARRWWASRGYGAWMSFQGTAGQINVSAVKSLKDASVSFSEWNDPEWDLHGRREPFDALLRSAWRSRAYGDFWSHMMVAEGIVDVAVEPQLFPWDMAALIPIIEEAGGVVTALDGTPPMIGGNALSSNGHLHGELLDLFGR
ncbi:MAG TPA: inositol monophosphatase family protein [Actinomycetes bacterium]|nr:inositol monophosphatase family protein [Actinomycetes bacterium]